jgi:RHS repeat-associated protein
VRRECLRHPRRRPAIADDHGARRPPRRAPDQRSRRTRDPQGNLLEKRGPTANHYYIFDGLGSVLGLTNSSGALISGFVYQYGPFGEPLNTPPAGYPANLWRYAGNFNTYYDTGTSDYKVGNRYYDPSVGRWTQTDASVDPLDTHGWTQYPYVGDDPINAVDPSGMCVLCSNPLGVVSFYHRHTRAISCGFLAASVGLGVADVPLLSIEVASAIRVGALNARRLATATNNGTASGLSYVGSSVTGGCL